MRFTRRSLLGLLPLSLLPGAFAAATPRSGDRMDADWEIRNASGELIGRMESKTIDRFKYKLVRVSEIYTAVVHLHERFEGSGRLDFQRERVGPPSNLRITLVGAKQHSLTHSQRLTLFNGVPTYDDDLIPSFTGRLELGHWVWPNRWEVYFDEQVTFTRVD